MSMDEAAWRRLEAHAESGLAKALAEGRGVDALAMLEALKQVADRAANYRGYERAHAIQNAHGRRP